MITIRYIPLPIANLSYSFVYKLEGDVELDWTYGSVTNAVALYSSSKEDGHYMKDFARGQAGLITANMNGTTRKREDFKDVEVKMISMGAKYLNGFVPPEPEEIQVQQDGVARGQTLKVTKTDKLVVEYIQIPKADNRVHFLFRFAEPMEMVWTLQSADCTIRDIKRNDDGTVDQFNRHQSVEEILKAGALRHWEAVLLDGFSANQYGEERRSPEVPTELKWMMQLKEVEVRRMELAEGYDLNGQFGTISSPKKKEPVLGENSTITFDGYGINISDGTGNVMLDSTTVSGAIGALDVAANIDYTTVQLDPEGFGDNPAAQRAVEDLNRALEAGRGDNGEA